MTAVRRIALLGCLATMASAVCVLPAGAAPRTDPPVWSDEFNGTSLDTSRWSHRQSGLRWDGTLTADAVSVGGGALMIKTYTNGGTHYSGMISTQTLLGLGGFEQTYGHFEARIRFNSSSGGWSAFWLQSPTMGATIGDPASSGVEMDVAEHRARCVDAPAPEPLLTCTNPGGIADRVQTALLWDGYGADGKVAAKLSAPLAGLANGSWHTWALRWTPTDIVVLYDDVPIWSQSGPISRRSEYIVLSSEVRASFAGPIPAGGYGTLADEHDEHAGRLRARVADDGAAQHRRADDLRHARGRAHAGLRERHVVRRSRSDVHVPVARRRHADRRRDSVDLRRAGERRQSRSSVPRDGNQQRRSRQCHERVADGRGTARPGRACRRRHRRRPCLRRRRSRPSRSRPSRRRRRRCRTPSRRPRGCQAAATSGSPRPSPSRSPAPTRRASRPRAARLRVPRVRGARALTYKPTARSAVVAADERVVLRLRLSRAVRVAISRALRSRARSVLRLRVRVADATGNARTLTREISFRR